MTIRNTLREKMLESLALRQAVGTRRDVRLPKIPGKTLAVIGMRRAGKTTFLHQCMADRAAAGAPAESQFYLHLEDDRLAGITTADLSWLIEEYYHLHAAFRDQHPVGIFLDEIQLVPGWETFIRRLMDSEKVDIFLSGSSAKMLSREVATSMRGRAMEVLVHPFSFREALLHAGAEPDQPYGRMSKAKKSALNQRLRNYLKTGGFPEAQGLEEADRIALLRGYVDSVLLRDVIERHNIGQAAAVRWMTRQLLGNAGGLFSIGKFHEDLRSQGLAIAKDTTHALLGHLEDAFLVRTLSLDTTSERQRMTNPRKAYPVDPGFIALFDRSESPQIGHALETAVAVELERRHYTSGYLKTESGLEVDFHARPLAGESLLIQVCADTSNPATLLRETRALEEAKARFPKAKRLLITLDAAAPELPKGVEWKSAAGWLLEERSP